MLFGFKLHRTGFPIADRAAWRQILKEAWEQAGIFWHKSFRELHFEEGATKRYGYAPRQGEGDRTYRKGFWRSYTGKKLKKYGHTKPLVLSGTSCGLTRLRSIQATANKVRVPLHAPALNFHRDPSPVEMWKDATTITTDEGTQIARFMDRYLDSRLRRYHASQTVTEIRT